MQKNKHYKVNWIYDNFLLSLKYVIESKNYILFSFLVLLIFISIGFSFPNLFGKEVLKIIEELVQETKGLGLFDLTSFIIFNNLKSSFFGLFFGLFFSIVPIFMTIVNGYVLGFVIQKSIAVGGILVLWRLFPHGIFEIPAVIISVGLGIKMGSFLYNKKLMKIGFLNLLKISMKVFLLVIIPLLVIAGLIEGFLIWALS